MKLVSVKDAVGMVLAHDMTQIIPGKSKDAAFRKGHIITSKDVPQLLSMGKDHIYIFELKSNHLHENDAAMRMATAAGNGIVLSEPKEGKVDLLSSYDGLVKVNHRALHAINEEIEVMFATIHTNQAVVAGKMIGGTRIIPLTIPESRIEKVEKICKENYPLIEVKPFKSMKAGIIITGTEVYEGRIQDGFGPVLSKKFTEANCASMKPIFVRDDAEMIAESIQVLLHEGAEIIVISGGMSVDPDDVTPVGIKKAGASIVSYGAPILPGAMFLLSYIEDVPVLGLPGCVMYNKRSIFDLVFQRILAGEKLTRQDITSLGHGGICLRCENCIFPNCSFGKGGLY
ncbi:molybdopterin-binding protein [Clostridium formicaceticum]|uniref:Molybdopterin molybdenumtransferase n=1 Tax=Clostridium formicaceticum TaxID=1497 RepID=A0AAC9WFM4_9CLOT|nr:molybdopterin-binding protein [Clostridium formicaceticum]AOY76453.1 molybdopterin-binding protein [Clostridium formicaceticum]ARE86849.1 bifunctional molybdenum cofactor biosynthesis protein MoaC/MogA [Clostridium formicaceticum]